MPMYPKTLEALLKELTLSSIALNAEWVTNTAELDESLFEAVSCRRIVDCVQFEQYIPNSSITFKLAPDVCEASYDYQRELNKIKWSLVLPKLDAEYLLCSSISPIDVLSEAQIDLQEGSSWVYDVLKTVIEFEQ